MILKRMVCDVILCPHGMLCSNARLYMTGEIFKTNSVMQNTWQSSREWGAEKQNLVRMARGKLCWETLRKLFLERYLRAILGISKGLDIKRNGKRGGRKTHRALSAGQNYPERRKSLISN